MPSATMSSDTGTVPTRVTSSRFIGRSRELAELEAALADASAGRPSLAFIAGESGVGKTRLLKELERGALAADARVVSGDCVSLGEDELPYAPIVAALRSLTRDGDPVLDELGPATRAGLASLLPELAPATALPVMDRDAPAQSRVFEALLTLLDQLGRDEPVLLAIEDLHWADASTRAFLSFLARSLRAERVLVVASYRPDELHRRHPLRPLLAELERGPRARRIELAPLTRAELAEQLEDILGAAPDDARVDAHVRAQRGQPALHRGAPGRRPRRARRAAPDAARRADGPHRGPARRTPRSVLRVLVRRRAASTTRCWPRPRAWSPAALREALREAAAGHVIEADERRRLRLPPRAAARGRPRRPAARRARRAAPGARARVRAPHAGRRAATRRLAAGIAHHYLSAGDQPAGFAAAVRAGDAAEEVHAHGEAARLYERALQLWSRVPDPEALAGHRPRHAAVPRRPPAHHDTAARRGALRGGAARDRRGRRALPRRRPARAASPTCAGASAPPRAALTTLERGLALLPDRRREPRARAAARPAGEVPHAARAPSQRRRGRPATR